MSDEPRCELCGEPMPEGEEMFKFHGYSGPCPKPPLVKEPSVRLNSVTGKDMRLWEMAVLLYRAMKHIPDGHKDKKAILFYLQHANVSSPLRNSPIYGSEDKP